MSIWYECHGLNHKKSLSLQPWRIVEAQHISSSRDLVDTKEEHDILEALIEQSKPKLTHDKHYLISTPFRYPPLKYGSRFGHIYEPSIWYGSIKLATAFAEVAYYRLKFLNDSEVDLGFIEIPVTAFKTHLQTSSGIDLSAPPFNHYQHKISHQTSYEDSQRIGMDMREAGIETFIFVSARDKNQGKNVGAFIPDVFKLKNKQYIYSMQNWRCMANKNVIEFSREELLARKHFEFT